VIHHERPSMTRKGHGRDGISKGLRAGLSAPALQALVLVLLGITVQ